MDVTFTSPMIFFTHSKLIERPMIRTTMDCAEGFLEEIGSEGYRPVGEGLNARIDDARTLLVDTLAESILEKPPPAAGRLQCVVGKPT